MPPPQHVFQPPTGTRDFYPSELARLRYIQDAWRRVSIRHGFEEVDGPTFEHLNLYTVKSGQGIVSELFSFERAGGEKTYALRPEFTPTLARMFAARANALARPTKWYWQQNCFRAERPQRGRLREFWQWNIDLLGDDSARADAEVIACAVDLFRELGLTPEHLKIRISHRGAVESLLLHRGVEREALPAWFHLLDRIGKIPSDDFTFEAGKLGMSASVAVDVLRLITMSTPFEASTTELFLSEHTGGRGPEYFRLLFGELQSAGVAEWCVLNLGIVRGLAYYTGMVFEVHEALGKERAVAGGGRYDTLIELFGGPPTPAIGFGMGDAVLSLILQDKGLMPDDKAIGRRLGTRPDVYVVSGGDDGAEARIGGMVAALRRAGFHARRSYKASKNLGKLIKDASSAGSHYLLIIEPARADGQFGATIKDLESGHQHPEPIPLEQVVNFLKS
jgi:histidyl-tRNA synthetase